MIVPIFTIDDVRYSEGQTTYARARELFDHGKVTNFEFTAYGYLAVVRGTNDYIVSLSSKALELADCTCYMGQTDQLCKHVLAVALVALSRQGCKTDEAARILTTEEAKLRIRAGLKKIRAYSGPSKIWFSYQRQLSVGAGIIVATVKQLPPTPDNAILIWKTVLRLSKKLSTGGVDDSDGSVGNGCGLELIATLHNWAATSDDLYHCIEKFTSDETGLGFEDELRTMFNR